jgi:hypothetical protein
MRKKLLPGFFDPKKISLGKINTGFLYLAVIMFVIVGFAFLMMGGTFPDYPAATTKAPSNLGEQEIVFTQDPDPGKKTQQLQTFTVKNKCEDKIAVNFLIDVSGSMRDNNKIEKEKNALRAFTGKMSDNSVIGMQIFSDPNIVREILPLSLYKDVKQQAQDAINSLTTYRATSTRDGFNLSKQKLTEAINQNAFPDYQYNLVFLSDGVPEVDMPESQKTPENCLATAPYRGQTRCFAKAQDPRSPTNIPNEIKLLGVDIYSIAITDSVDQPLKNELLQLLKDAASDPDSTYFFESVDGNDLQTVLNNVLKSICSNT